MPRGWWDEENENVDPNRLFDLFKSAVKWRLIDTRYSQRYMHSMRSIVHHLIVSREGFLHPISTSFIIDTVRIYINRIAADPDPLVSYRISSEYSATLVEEISDDLSTMIGSKP